MSLASRPTSSSTVAPPTFMATTAIPAPSTTIRHHTGQALRARCPGVTLADNAIEFYSDMYDNWYYSSQWHANFFRGPRQPGFEGAGSYDVAHFWVFGFYTALTVESTIMRIPS